MIAAAPLDPRRTALLLIASPGDEPPARPGHGAAEGLLACARACGAHVVHVLHERGAPAPVPAASQGWETVVRAGDDDPFAGTELAVELAARGVEAVVVAGPMTLACCAAASGGALRRRYRTILAADALDAREQGRLERDRVLRDRDRAGAEILSTDAIACLLGAPAA